MDEAELGSVVIDSKSRGRTHDCGGLIAYEPFPNACGPAAEIKKHAERTIRRLRDGGNNDEKRWRKGDVLCDLKSFREDLITS